MLNIDERAEVPIGDEACKLRAAVCLSLGDGDAQNAEPAFGLGYLAQLAHGASGYIAGVRYRNQGPIQHYLKAVSEGNARLSEEVLTKEEMMEEELFLGLRKKSGVSIAKFEERFGISFEERYGQVVAELRQQGLLVPDDEMIRMTKKGLFLGDTVAEKFII